MGLINWLGGNESSDESIGDLVKRAQKLLKEKEASESESKALVVRRDTLPPYVWQSGGNQVSLPVVRDVEVYSPRMPRLAAGPACGNVTQYNQPAIIELPRWCAVYDERWLAAYEPGPNGKYTYVTSREFPTHQQHRYAQENIITLPPGFRANAEKCGCCQTWTRSGSVGAVHCGNCSARVCYGRTSPGGLFRCRKSCGEIGQLEGHSQDETGLVPGR